VVRDYLCPCSRGNHLPSFLPSLYALPEPSDAAEGPSEAPFEGPPNKKDDESWSARGVAGRSSLVSLRAILRETSSSALMSYDCASPKPV
jgi:hypothetical protein